MSRVGNKPIPLPSGVKIKIEDQLLVEGPKGKLSLNLPALVWKTLGMGCRLTNLFPEEQWLLLIFLRPCLIVWRSIALSGRVRSEAIAHRMGSSRRWCASIIRRKLGGIVR